MFLTVAAIALAGARSAAAQVCVLLDPIPSHFYSIVFLLVHGILMIRIMHQQVLVVLIPLVAAVIAQVGRCHTWSRHTCTAPHVLQCVCVELQLAGAHASLQSSHLDRLV